MLVPRTFPRLVLILGLVAVTVLVAAPAALAKPGDLDASFGTGGTVTTPIGSGEEEARAVAIQADGKIVAVGYSDNGSNFDFALARYTAAGVLDPAFGTSGKLTTAIGAANDGANAVAIQTDGKIVVAGYSDNGSSTDFALARYTAAGTLDATFGNGGKVLTDFGSTFDNALAVALQADGKIVAAGSESSGLPDFALARYTTAGALDTTFGSGGKVTTPIGSSSDTADAVAIQADGKIVAAGGTINGPNNDFALVRYVATGALDSSFGTAGKVTTAFGTSTDIARAVAIQSDGKIVAVGETNSGSGGTIDDNFGLARYTTTGALDATFGTGGKVVTQMGSVTDDPNAVAIQSNGKIVAAGVSLDGSFGERFALARYTTTGALDTSFGTGGKVTGSNSGQAYGVAIQANGAIVAAGRTHSGSSVDFALARYQGDPSVVAIAQSGSSFFFSPGAVVGLPGISVQWVNTSFNPPTTHTTTGDAPLSFWNSGNLAAGASFTQVFTVAGVYPYHCAIHGFTGLIQINPKASPASGSPSTNFTITWAGGTIPAGYAADVGIKRPGSSTFLGWRVNRTGAQVSAQFTPDAGAGTYTFGVRLRNVSTGAVSGPTLVAISVS